MSVDIWVASTSEECLDAAEEFVSREKAIAEAREHLGIEAEDGFYIGIQEEWVPPIESGQDYLENMIDRNCEELGDWSEHWESTVVKNQELCSSIEKKLEDIQSLILKLQKPTFFTVKNVEFIEGE